MKVEVQSLSLEDGAKSRIDLRLSGRAVAVWVHVRGGPGQFNLSYATGRHKVKAKPTPKHEQGDGIYFSCISSHEIWCPVAFSFSRSQGCPESSQNQARHQDGLVLRSSCRHFVFQLPSSALSYKPGRRVTSSYLNVRGHKVRKLQNSVEATRISRTGSS
ncbi:C7orf33 isoform 1 [Pongo abelii]|uniref:C7orf33 isoform 1 n=1 Tax=Pongo abelii TaxID=9601 RepID=A0A2J8S701_PONAB|nr:C7orf33 isoform 1 [Pongo abelii]